ncbi:MAG: glycosyltransferase [Planctomycetaceae bacterium]|jgi:glycosyltransferase involved in cell wall biosynthesis|nr:glycosyltransferase [Planctomycetaceae bacterium]
MTLSVAHVTASPNFGGVERLILEVCRSLEKNHDVRHVIASFPEGGHAEPFLAEIEKSGFTGYRFQNDMPHLLAAAGEYCRFLKQNGVRILCAHGHKARILGWFAARRLKIPIIGVSHGWTGENKKIQFFERIDKWMHRRMDHVVCVSQGQADKVIRFGTPPERVSVIYNAVRLDRFAVPSALSFRERLEAELDRGQQKEESGNHSPFASPVSSSRFILGAAGRLSPEKGFDLLIAATERLIKKGLPVGLVIFGDGILREPLQKQIDNLGIGSSVSLAGFTDQLDKFMFHFDVFVQSSHTEGMPSVLLEAMSAKTAVVATSVGGTGELVTDGETGILVPPNDVSALANALQKVLEEDRFRRKIGAAGRQRVETGFAIDAQTEKYWELFNRLLSPQTVKVS